MALQTLAHDFMQIPPVTRGYVSVCILTTAAVVSESLFFYFKKQVGYIFYFIQSI